MLRADVGMGAAVSLWAAVARVCGHCSVYVYQQVAKRLQPSGVTQAYSFSLVAVLESPKLETRAERIILYRFSAFQVVSAYTNTGMSLVDQSMVPFQRAYPMVLILPFIILAGNTAFVRSQRCSSSSGSTTDDPHPISPSCEFELF